MGQSNRIFYYDALRAIAIMGIIFCHASVSFILLGVDIDNFYISAFYDCFRDFSIPIFVMLSGALLILKKDSFKDFFKKRLSRILIPFVFWVLIYIVYSLIYIVHGFNLSNSIDIFFGTSSTLGVAFWFIWMIIIAYFLIYVVNWLTAYNYKIINIFTLMSLVYIFICQFGLFNPYSSKLVYFVSFMSYIIIGYYISHNNYLENIISPNKIVLVTLIISVASYAYYIFCYVVPTSISHGQFIYMGYFSLPILLMSVNIFLLFKYLSKSNAFLKMERNSVGMIITTISKYSFGIYLAHYVILHSLKLNLSKFIDFSSQNPIIWIPIIVILTLMISILVLAILNRIPYLSKFSGNS